ncbi:hypothetical protein BP6252_08816 [Coleophoma cylindrospora]|uniref:Heterokaryon incompatibility domain-containing protein n=1 Tax=Coleophoma cylindrospora TaxID=1849047 RepID=A0A3D8R735_9HELO|nr:hypothetical protein BP6252_08816 [Coleophoma cylindrospora]
MFRSKSAPFVYRPLQWGEIRLLHVLPGSRSKDIRCSIEVHQRHQSLNYEALSYTWGDPDLKEDILCNGQKLSIRRNLAIALRALRYTDRPRVLWVDAVCINQNDGDERAVQVRLMCDIYHDAQRVVAWVGEESGEDQAIFKIEKFIDIPSKTEHTTEEDLTWLSVANFIRRSWFRRVWIVQELAVARRLTLFCGTRQIEWEVLRKALFKFVDRCGVFLNTTKADISLEGIFTLLSIRNLVTDHKPENQELQGRFFQLELNQIDNNRKALYVQGGDLCNFVKGTRLFGSSDPRDHIYAMLGLVLPEESQVIPVNYSRSNPYQTAFRNFALSCITQSGYLDVLSQAGLHESLPSWAPDWTQTSQSYSLPTGAYSASGKTKAQVTPVMKTRPFNNAVRENENTADVLIFRGKIIDTVRVLTPGFAISSEPSDQVFEKAVLRLLKIGLPLTSILSGNSPLKDFPVLPKSLQEPSIRIKPPLEKQWRQLADTCAPYPTGQSVSDAYTMTLIGDLPFNQLGSAPQSLRHECFRIWREQLPENPVMIRGALSSSTWTGKSSNTGETIIRVDPQLTKLFSQHDVSSREEQRVRMEKDNLVLVNPESRFPVYANKTLVKGYQGISKLLRGGEKPAEKNEEEIAVDDAKVKMSISRLFGRRVERLARNRQFCKTARRYMGWVPGSARVDDVICLLEGGSVPFVLRRDPNSSAYRLVGEAYIHGLMYGEGMGFEETGMQDIWLL